MKDERKEFLEAFGKKVKKLRIENGLTLEELANKMGYTTSNARSSVNKIESGKSDLPASKIKRLAEIFGMSASELMEWDQKANHEQIYLEEEIAKYIQKIYGKDALQIFSNFLELNEHERNKISEMLSGYSKLDEVDRAEVLGYVKGMIESLLNNPKYSSKEGLKNA